MYEVCAHAQTPMEWVFCFSAYNHLFFGEYTCTFEMHMVYNCLVVDMGVYELQV
jgi:hypothetical protein